MNYSKLVSAAIPQSKRRPTGVSRRQKRRQLGFETLEDRRVMSATPATAGLEFTDSQVRELLLDGPTLSLFADAANLSQYTDAQLASTHEWIVLAAEGVSAQQIEAATGVAIAGATGIVPWSYVVDTSSASPSALVESLSGSELVDFFYPLVPLNIESLAVTNDEYLENQWHLINFGQNVGNPDFSPIFGTVDEDINIEGAWDFVTGSGVVIGIVDEGVQLTHPDLLGNIRFDLGVDLVQGSSGGGSTLNDPHGTAVAGIAAGVGNNGIGITGVAYEADIAPIRLFSSSGLAQITSTDTSVAAAFLHEAQNIDVYNHSWGFAPPADDQGAIANPRSILNLGPLATTALRNSVFFGRGGLGGIHVFAAGNERGANDSGNYAETVNSRYTIGVTSVIEDGSPTGYAESSAAALVAAPSGSNALQIIRDDELGSGIYTTDLQGDNGYNEGPGLFGIETDADFLADTDYSSRFNGTSASAPIVSGVIALMLEANPNLTYRDVQHILVRSARQNDAGDITWVTNNQQLFNDPLAFDSDTEDTIFDGDWPRAQPGTEEVTHTQVYYAQPTLPYQFTNGAGLTVSQLNNRTDNGYAHGVVDATLAVELARNWVTLGGQTSEFTWTTGSTLAGQINAAAVSSEETGEFRIPGGVIGDGDPNQPNSFIDFFDEFGEEDDPAVPDLEAEDPGDPDGPFSGDDPPVNTRGGYIPLAPPPMSVEWVEVELNLTAPDANDFDFLRVVLVSPDGTQSELKNFHINDPQHPLFNRILTNAADDPTGNITNDNANLNAVFTTNRHWGERTEGKVRLNTDGTPVNNFDGSKTIDNMPNPNGSPIVDGWKLVFENYGDAVINIGTFEVAFHGIDTTGTGRIQGLVGVDDNFDELFSYDGGEELVSNFTRYSEINRLDDLVDPELELTPQDFAFVQAASSDPYIFRDLLPVEVQESWAAGLIVYVDLDHNGVRNFTDPHYQIGADGNYYFDLPVLDPEADAPYHLRIDPSSLEAAGINNEANQVIAKAGPFAQTHISTSGERVTGFKVFDPIEGTNTLLGSTSVPELNLLLSANTQPENIVNLSGVVYADLNTNGINDANYAPIGGANVFIDLNQNGVFTPGIDFYTTTAGDGSYSFVDQEITPGFYSVVVLEGTTGSFGIPVNPDDAQDAFFFAPELVRTDLDFGFTLGGTGGGPGGGGGVGSAISGVVFEDVNSNGVRGLGDAGLAGVATVYLDLNDNNELDGEDLTSTTFGNGSFVFNALAAGSYAVRIEFDNEQYQQTTPAGLPDSDGIFDPDDFETRVTISTGSIASGIDFGLHNRAVADFGDLPSQFYPTTEAQNGARHLKFGDLYLGQRIDAELDAPAGSNGLGDDQIGIDDEDGVAFSDLFDNSTSITATVTANTNGGFLQAWLDFNEDHLFQASELVIPETLINQGNTDFVIPVPANLTSGTVYARFRYGEQGIVGFTGLAQKGEVEDYAIEVISTAIDPGNLALAPVNNQGADFDGDGRVTGSDFLAWQRGFGTANAAPADGDANNDGEVDGDDLTIFQQDYGTGTAVPAISATADFDGDGDTDGADFLAWQRGVGSNALATLADGDGNQDGSVDGEDLQLWQDSYGQQPAAAQQAAEPVVYDEPSLDLLAAYRTAETSSVTAASGLVARGPQIVQPGFPEELGASVVDTNLAAPGSGHRGLAGLATAFERLAAQHRQGSTASMRLESLLEDRQQPLAASDLGLALRDQALEPLALGRRQEIERLVPDGREQPEIEATLAAAFEQELDWRLG